MSDIFISYAREDRASARQLAEGLEGHGWTVWWDHSLRAGESFRKTIELRLGDAKAVIVLWSEHSVESSFVLDEASRAQRRDVLAPVVVDGLDAHRFPLGFGDLHAEDLSDWTGEPRHEGYGKLVELLSSRIGAGTRPSGSSDRLDAASSWNSSGTERLAQPQGLTQPKYDERGRAVLDERDHARLLRGAYAGATTVGALLLIWALAQGQDWNMWLALAVPLISWGILGFALARRSVTRAAGLALVSLVLGLIIFGTAPG